MLNPHTYRFVDEHNMASLDVFPGKYFTVSSATTVSPYRAQKSDLDISETIVLALAYNYGPTGVHPHKLYLKIGVPVMVICNNLHHVLVNKKVFVVVPVDQYTMLVARCDVQGHKREI